MTQFQSVKWKILTPMILVFLLIMVFINLYSSHQQKARLLETTEQHLNQVLDNYLDGINMLMLTGSMASRDTLRDKFAQQDGIEEVRVLRADAVNKLFGPGFPSEKPQDEYDRRALNGEAVSFVETVNGERKLTVIEPYIAVENRHGTNCLGCHQVAEGTVLGAGRITYSLAAEDSQVLGDLINSSLMNAVLMIAGLLGIYFVIYRIVIQPLRRLERTMGQIGTNSDLTLRVNLGTNDEFSRVEEATNRMLNSFQPAISDLSHTMSELSGVSGELALITRETRDGMGEQQRESKDLLVAVEELSDAAGRVNESAVNAETAAVSAKDNAEGGSEVVVQVTGTIQELAAEVENAVTVVRQLAEDTQGIGHVAKSINEIAEQTNLLALNAAIEAARAGEQGRGFAVVADEVRSLAIRTQDSTKEINDIIERLVSVSEKAVQVMDASKDRAQQGVQDTERAREALQQIATGVENIRSMNSRISAAADNQNNVVSRINENIRVISQASEQTLSASGRTFEHSNDLGQIVQRLREIVERFRV